MHIGETTYNSIAYGPIRSRRLGISLGVNLMPDQHKLCSFNCVYCECGWNPVGAAATLTGAKLPTREQVREAIAYQLKRLQAEKSGLDVITFSGNGEPTLHPDFIDIIRDTCALRDEYYPAAKVSVLSNSTQLGRPEVVEALRLCDNRILKLDAATDEMMRAIDLPVNPDLNVERIVEWLKQFEGDFTLQTCFLRTENGPEQTPYINNTTPDQLAAWYHMVDILRPRQIMIYVIDRKTPMEGLVKISADEMAEIARPLREKGFDVIVSA